MATDPWSLSTTAASNTTIGGVSAAEGILPANLNNIDRALGAGLAEMVKVIGGGITSGGSGDAQTITTGLSWSAYAANQVVWFEAGYTNTGATTLAIDGLAAKAVTTNGGSALSAGDITAGGFYGVFYEAGSDNFHLVNPGTGAVGLSNVVEDTTPQLGGQLDVNGNPLGDGTNELVTFTEDASAVNHLNIENEATGAGPILRAAGDDTNIDLNLDAKGTGVIRHNQPVLIAESSAAEADVAGYGQFWVKDDAPNLPKFTDDAGTDFTLAAAGKHSIYIPAGAMTAASTSGAASGSIEETTNKHNYATLDFDASSDEYACFEILMPKDWNESTLTFQVSWTTTATDTDGVAWALQAVAVADGDDSDVAYGTAVVVTDDAQSNAGDVLITSESGAVTVAGSPAAGELTQFRLFRDVSDANDDMTEDALLRGVRIYYTTDALNEA